MREENSGSKSNGDKEGQRARLELAPHNHYSCDTGSATAQPKLRAGMEADTCRSMLARTKEVAANDAARLQRRLCSASRTGRSGWTSSVVDPEAAPMSCRKDPLVVLQVPAMCRLGKLPMTLLPCKGWFAMGW
jgi:hypothetical protein